MLHGNNIFKLASVLASASLLACTNTSPDTAPTASQQLDSATVSTTTQTFATQEAALLPPKPECLSDSQCDDGNQCTTNVCVANKCQVTFDVGTPCDDGNECTWDTTCWDGKCGAGIVDPKQSCDDGNACTSDDKCQSWGGCLGKGWKNCDDDNVCTADYCDAELGCVNKESSSCNDGNPCTKDICDPVKGCRFEPQSGACDDGNECTIGEQCNDQGQCGGGKLKECDQDDDACTVHMCEQAWGCIPKPGPGGVPCDDGDACTTGDECWDGKCNPGTPTDCDDGNVCTVDTCEADGGCLNKDDNGAKCDDGDACTEMDECWDGKCGGDDVDCDDGNVCTADSCDPAKGCVNKNTVGTPCDDGDVCTLNDSCWDGACNPGTDELDCDDGNQCTTDSCDPIKGCENNAKDRDGGKCDDGNACTEMDECWDGVCSGKDVDCDDGNQCTADSCDPAKGCENKDDNGAKCDDGDVCTDMDDCWDGKCSGTPLDCDDDNVCTIDSCKPGVGCVNEFDDGASCSDGDVCNGDETCWDGDCKAGQALDCDDGDQCTADSCDPKDGCKNSTKGADGTPCDDGDLCTEKDECWDGKCGGTEQKCDDGNECTADLCINGECHVDLHELDGEKCDDGDVCNGEDSCWDGKCQTTGDELDCDDGDKCTLDSCDPTKGCVNEENPLCDKECYDGVDLGAAAGFNVFTCGSYEGLLDAGGKVAIRDSFMAAGFSIGSTDPGGDALVVGAYSSLKNGTVHGNIVHNAPIDVRNVTADDIRKDKPVEFVWECKNLRSQAWDLAAATVTGTTVVHAWGGVVFRGDNPITNVFSVKADDISNAVTIQADVPAGSTTVVLVRGNAGVTFQNLGMFGLEAENTLWVMESIDFLKIQEVTFVGSVLAPKATVWFENANVYGHLITGSVEGGGEVHEAPLGEVKLDTCSDEVDTTLACTYRATTTNHWGAGGQYHIQITSTGATRSDWAVKIDANTDLDLYNGWMTDIWFAGDFEQKNSGRIVASSSGGGSVGGGASFGVGFVAGGDEATSFEVRIDGKLCTAK